MKYNRQSIIDNSIKSNFDLMLICGIPGSGKTTIAQEFSNNGYEIISIDDEKYRLALQNEQYKNMYLSEIGEDLNNFSDKAFEICIDKCSLLLLQNKKCVFDSNNTTIKKRSLFIKKIQEKIKNAKISIGCIYLDVSLNTAISQNEKRASMEIGISNITNEPVYDKYVSEKDIINKYNSQILPIKEYESFFNEIYILHEDNFEYKPGHLQDVLDIYNSKNLFDYCKSHKDIINEMFPEYENVWNFNQKNPHHNLKLDDHILSVANQLKKERIEIFLAGLLHDIGKPFTQLRRGIMIMDSMIFKAGEKVDIVSIKQNGFVVVEKRENHKYANELVTIKHVVMNDHYNYYNHENVGAIIARRRLEQLMFTEEQCNLVYRYILHHMVIPIDTKHSSKTLKKVLKKIGKDIIKDVIKIKLADKTSSNSSSESLENLYYNINEIKKL